MSGQGPKHKMHREISVWTSIRIQYLKRLAALVVLFASMGQVAIADAEPAKASEMCMPAWGPFAGVTDLPSTILSGTRGPDDFIYLGGRDGLYRLEGRAVEFWRPDFSDPNALPAGRISALIADGDQIWVGTAAGLVQFTPSSNTIERVALAGANERQPAINAMARFGKDLYTAYNGTLLRFDVTTDARTVEKLELDDSGGFSIRDLLATDDHLYVASNKGLYVIEASGEIEQVPLDGDAHSFNAIILGPDQAIWALGNDAVWVSSAPLSGDWKIYPQGETPGLAGGTLIAITKDEHDRVWIGSDEGLSRWDAGASYPAACRRALQGSDRDQDISVAFLTADFGPYIFLGSNGRGATYAPLSEYISLVIPGERFSPGLPDNPIWSSEIASDGRLLFGTSSGLFGETSAGSRAFEPLGEAELGTSRIYTIKDLGPEGIWIGTNKGAYRLQDGVVEPIAHIHNGDGLPAYPAVFDIEHSEGQIFLATGRGLLTLDDEDYSPIAFFRTSDIYYVPDVTIQNDLAATRVWSLNWHDGDLLFAGSDGVFRLDPKTHSIEASTVAAMENGSLVAGRIYSVVGAREDEILLGTEAGLVSTDRNFSRFEAMNEINGLPIESVMTTGRARDGAVWIGAAGRGLFRLDPKTHAWQHITAADGLITNGVSQLGLTLASDGRVIVSNATGASIIDELPNGVASKKDTVFSISDQYSQSELSNGARFIIGPDRRDLRLHFAVADLVEPGRLRVHYSFTPAGAERSKLAVPLGEDLTFLNLAPGRYEFDAALASSSGVELATRSLLIEVKAFWWERRSTHALLFLVGLIRIAVLFGLRSRAVERRYGLVANERKRVAQDLHDTFLQDVFGARMIGRSLVDDQSSDDAKVRIERVLGLLDSATKSVRESVNQLNNLTDVEDLSEAVRTLEPPARFGGNIGIEVVQTGSSWGMREQRRFFIFRVIQEAITNACKHSKGSKITVALNWTWHSLKIEVRDDGQGFDRTADTFTPGFGLEAMDCMAEAARVKLDIDSQPRAGTSVRIKVQRFLL